MFYEFGNFIPWREAAWTLLTERAELLAVRARRTATLPGAPAVTSQVADSAAAIAASLGNT